MGRYHTALVDEHCDDKSCAGMCFCCCRLNVGKVRREKGITGRVEKEERERERRGGGFCRTGPGRGTRDAFVVSALVLLVN